MERNMPKMVCPVWLGYLLVSPIRKIVHNPQAILGPYIKEGMTVLDVGCGMGFFSIPAAQMVGTDGKVICVDMQRGMLDAVEKRAYKAGVLQRIETRLCDQNTLGLGQLAGTIDFALVFAVVHEVPDPSRIFAELGASLRPSGNILVVEPRGHVSEKAFTGTILEAHRQGLENIEIPQIPRSRAVLLRKTV
jgi:ubiquinone/menaquinone biosynthesis C-methylase UbiE